MKELKKKSMESKREAVAIYKGQATIGNIMNVVLYEGRHALSYFRNEIPRLSKKIDKFIKNQSTESVEGVKSIAEGIGKNADEFVRLFGRLDTLATGRRLNRKKILLLREIKRTAKIFESDPTRPFDVEITGDKDITVLGYVQDIATLFSNLIENSLYWMNIKDNQTKKISIALYRYDHELVIDYRDTGIGIEPNMIENGIVFEPNFSKKPGGTGLGLAIAGEAALRLGMELKVISSKNGAHFKLSLGGKIAI